MKIRVFTPNEKGKIEFTRAELEKLLNEVYAEGQNDCNCGHITWTNPYNPYTPYITCSDSTTTNASTNGTAETATITLNSDDARETSKRINNIFTTANSSPCVEDFITKLAKELKF